MSQRIVTLTTDFGWRDHFAATLKGALYSLIADVNVIDITHGITPFDIQQGAYALGHSWEVFPQGSIHIVCVGASPTQRSNHIAFSIAGHYFIGANNGLFSLMSDIRPDKVIEICAAGKEPSTFPALDIYVPVATAIASGKQLDEIGNETGRIAELLRPRHFPEEDAIKGNVVYIDSFGNLVTDIRRSEFERVGQDRPFAILLVGDEITTISKRYSDVDEGDRLALFNSDDVLEIAINQGKASQLLNMRINAVIRIVFS